MNLIITHFQRSNKWKHSTFFFFFSPTPLHLYLDIPGSHCSFCITADMIFLTRKWFTGEIKLAILGQFMGFLLVFQLLLSLKNESRVIYFLHKLKPEGPITLEIHEIPHWENWGGFSELLERHVTVNIVKASCRQINRHIWNPRFHGIEIIKAQRPSVIENALWECSSLNYGHRHLIQIEHNEGLCCILLCVWMARLVANR